LYAVTLSWDDGFRASSAKIAEIYEKFGLRADFNIVASFHLKNTAESGPVFGDFGWWNELQARGHFIHPHGLDHSNKAQLPLAEAQEKIRACLEIFGRELDGFDPARAVFAFPYNQSTPQVESWLAGEVCAFRTDGSAIQPFPAAGQPRLTTTGREDAEACLEECLVELFDRPECWLLYTVHGLDGEGWGPLRSAYLERVLGSLLERQDVRVLPTLDVLGAAPRP